MAVPVFLVHRLEDKVDVILEASRVTSPDHLELVIEGFVELEFIWASLEKYPFHVVIIVIGYVVSDDIQSCTNIAGGACIFTCEPTNKPTWIEAKMDHGSVCHENASRVNRRLILVVIARLTKW